jgi:hypothetical protein
LSRPRRLQFVNDGQFNVRRLTEEVSLKGDREELIQAKVRMDVAREDAQQKMDTEFKNSTANGSEGTKTVY